MSPTREVNRLDDKKARDAIYEMNGIMGKSNLIIPVVGMAASALDGSNSKASLPTTA